MKTLKSIAILLMCMSFFVCSKENESKTKPEEVGSNKNIEDKVIQKSESLENKKARELGEQELNKYLIKCGDGWFIKRLTAGPYELNKKGDVRFDESSLSEADKLNGFIYQGILTYAFNGAWREYRDYAGGWGDWQPTRIVIDIYVVNKRGVWSAAKSDDAFRGQAYDAISCDKVPAR